MNPEPRSKRLLILTSTFPRWNKDDEPPFVYELCRRLIKKYDIQVLAPHAPGALCEEVLDGIKVRRFCYFYEPMQNLCYRSGILSNLKENPRRYGLIPFFFLAEILAIINFIRKGKVDLIHAHWLLPQGLAGLLACLISRRRIPVLCTSHGGDLYGLKGRLLERLKLFVLSKSSAITVVSQAMRNKVKRLGLSSDKVEVIPMGVELQRRFVPPDRKENRDSILFVGRLVKKKGLKYLINALPFILERHGATRLDIVGDGIERKNCEEQVKKLGLSEHVCFHGALRQELLPAFYNNADIVVFPSIIADDGDQEGFGLVLVEAMGCGCAVVITDLPAMQDIVIDGKTGFVVPQKTVSPLAEKIIFLLKNDAVREKLGYNARKYVEGKFDWEIIVQQYDNLIDKTIKGLFFR